MLHILFVKAVVYLKHFNRVFFKSLQSSHYVIFGMISLVLIVSFQNCQQSPNKFSTQVQTSSFSSSNGVEINLSAQVVNPNNCSEGVKLLVDSVFPSLDGVPFPYELSYSFDGGKSWGTLPYSVFKETTAIAAGQIIVKNKEGTAGSNKDVYKVEVICPANSQSAANNSTPAGQVTSTSVPVQTSSSDSHFVNMVGGDEISCSASIFYYLGILNASCSIGGGCGGAGKPGPGNPSSNPNSWGACVEIGFPAAKMPLTGLSNFVSDDQQSCETSIYASHGMNIPCKIGGGCGNCGVPGPDCPSENPTRWGACF
ncbi:MAG: hypothetical protein ACXVCY_11790 [Pseudobdellovibrionaceae bacterium]